jgi:hypothetical protein
MHFENSCEVGSQHSQGLAGATMVASASVVALKRIFRSG